ncbi:hypothetical protein [Actinorhabdospora filicis]|uniref:hypothetical protein n=1 Tax=Actinorhabdospora filicis TaxID=1785913 RepID=UPI002554348F|nr:hypothetical protein [Actinorhabdospora filicis]
MLVTWTRYDEAPALVDPGARPGFIARAGGFERGRPGAAHVLEFWSDRFAYHDAGPVDASARTFITRRELSGGFQPRMTGVGLLRLTHVRVPGGRFGEVIDRANRRWEPALAVASGMLGGFLAEEGNSEVLVLSCWRTFDDHERYRAEIAARAGEPPPTPGEQVLVDVVPEWGR